MLKQCYTVVHHLPLKDLAGEASVTSKKPDCEHERDNDRASALN